MKDFWTNFVDVEYGALSGVMKEAADYRVEKTCVFSFLRATGS